MQHSIKSAIGVALIAAAAVANATSINPDWLPRVPTTPKVKEKGAERGADFGPSPLFYSTVDGAALHPRQDTATFERGDVTGTYYCKTGTPENGAFGQLHVPHGVQLQAMRVWIFDNQATSAVSVELESVCQPDFDAGFPVTTTLATVATTDVFAAGEFSDFDNPPANTISDNQSCVYRYRAVLGTAGCPGIQSLGIRKVRQQWQRFIPVAPAVASFTDVPVGSQFFREVEALVDTGVTAGCTATTFCPGNFVTRLQMAAFLARALGLPPQTIVDPANP